MKILKICILNLILIGCHSEKELSEKLPPDAIQLQAEIDRKISQNALRNKDYQLTSPAATLYMEPNEQTPNIEANNAFIKKSGLPFVAGFENWQSNHTFKESLQMYKSFVVENKDSKYINYFKQYQGWLLITHYELLSEKGNAKDVQYLVNEMIASKYDGYQFLYYSIEYLKNESYISKQDITSYVAAIGAYHEKNDKNVPLMEPDAKQSNGKPFPPGVIAMVNKRVKEKAESHVWIEKIEGLAGATM